MPQTLLTAPLAVPVFKLLYLCIFKRRIKSLQPTWISNHGNRISFNSFSLPIILKARTNSSEALTITTSQKPIPEVSSAVDSKSPTLFCGLIPHYLKLIEEQAL